MSETFTRMFNKYHNNKWSVRNGSAKKSFFMITFDLKSRKNRGGNNFQKPKMRAY